MKLHINRKMRKNIKRFISLALILCMTLSLGSSYVTAESADSNSELHAHNEYCYEKQYICGLEEHEGHETDCYTEHGDDCWQDRLVCGQEEADGHVHEESCYEEFPMTDCGMEEHNESCYRKVLICMDGTFRSSVSGSDAGADVMPEDTDKETDDKENAVTETNPVPEDAEDETKWVPNCESQDEEHEHEGLCFLSLEDREAVDRVNELISVLPAVDEIEAIEDMPEEEAYEEYLLQLTVQVQETYEAYMTLDQELRQYVTEAEKLMELVVKLEVLETDNEFEKEPESEEPFEAEYRDDKVIIRVTAEPGVIPEGAALSVREVVQNVATVQSDLVSDDAEISEAEEMNAKYEEVQKELEASVAEDDTKEIVGFLAYDISFLVTDENGETIEIEPEGNVSVTMEFVEAYIPEGIADDEEVQIDSVEVIHMKEVVDEETGEVGLKAEVLESAEVATTEEAEVEKAEFVVDSFSIFTISWTSTKYGSDTASFKAVCVDVNGNVITVPDEKIPPIDINLPSDDNASRFYFPALAPYIKGYKLNKIVLGSSEGLGTDGTEIYEVRWNDNDGKKWFYYYEGKWTDGKWEQGKNSWKLSGIKNDDSVLYFVYDTIPELGSLEPETPEGEETDKVPAHRKYIKYNEDEDDYTLTLDVKGEKGEQDIDILLIVDTSGSMKNTTPPRYPNLNGALNTLDTSLKKIVEDNTKLNVHVGIVTFAGAGNASSSSTNNGRFPGNAIEWSYRAGEDVNATPDAKIVGWTTITAEDGLTWRLKADDIAGSTNWQAAIRKGEEMLSTREGSNRKYVLFLTDGDPTMRYAAEAGSEISVGSGQTNGDMTIKNNYDAAINEWKISPTLQSATGAYVINVLESDGDVKFKCEELAKDIGATLLSGDNEEELKESFKTITDGITYSSYTGVEVVDTLSEYVEFKEETPSFTVSYKKADSNTTITAGSVSVEDGGSGTITDDENNSYTVTREGNTIRFSVLDGEELEDGTLYSISFKVKPTEKAVKEYITSGYCHMGWEDTDAPDNDTSSGKQGFYSNWYNSKSGRSRVYYSYNRNPAKFAEYNHPVVQVDKDSETAEEETGITKKMGAADEKGYPITIQINCGKIENNMFTAPVGDGWTVTDEIAPYTHFLSFAECELNGRKLTLSENKKQLLLNDRVVAQYSGSLLVAGSKTPTGEITWYLMPELANVVIDEEGNGYCSYSLTYYVRFSDSGKTEIRNTNTTTYITIPDGKYLYPEKMPYFVNVVGTKKSIVNGEDKRPLAGAVFNVYKDEGKTRLIAEGIIADEHGHFAFQLGQSDLCEPDMDNGEITVYLEEKEAPEGYVQDTVLHPLTVKVSDVEYVESESQAKGKPGIWDNKDGKDWGYVYTGSVVVEHNSHVANGPDFLYVNVDAASGKLELEYYNTKPWKILKISASDERISLEGAEFTLTRVSGGELVYKGISDADGYVDSWKLEESVEPVSSALLPAGTYELRETKAPAGYALSDEVWEIEISELGEVSIKKDGAQIDGEEGVVYSFKNEVLYTLPSTGSTGIFWYIIGGTLLMMAGVLVLYKRKNEEEVQGD